MCVCVIEVIGKGTSKEMGPASIHKAMKGTRQRDLGRDKTKQREIQREKAS